jgi:hypothetical protein
MTSSAKEALLLVDELLAKHIQRCRYGVSACPKWSPAQAEWSRARDALLNFQDDLNDALRAQSEAGQ